jgi:hypothetical protein
MKLLWPTFRFCCLVPFWCTSLWVDLISYFRFLIFFYFRGNCEFFLYFLSVRLLPFRFHFHFRCNMVECVSLTDKSVIITNVYVCRFLFFCYFFVCACIQNNILTFCVLFDLIKWISFHACEPIQLFSFFTRHIFAWLLSNLHFFAFFIKIFNAFFVNNKLRCILCGC